MAKHRNSRLGWRVHYERVKPLSEGMGIHVGYWTPTKDPNMMLKPPRAFNLSAEMSTNVGTWILSVDRPEDAASAFFYMAGALHKIGAAKFVIYAPPGSGLPDATMVKLSNDLYEITNGDVVTQHTHFDARNAFGELFASRLESTDNFTWREDITDVQGTGTDNEA
jgi:hypothetical protein